MDRDDRHTGGGQAARHTKTAEVHANHNRRHGMPLPRSCHVSSPAANEWMAA
jgi:hypothetical protein